MTEREQLIGKLSDTMDPDGAKEFVDRVIQEASEEQEVSFKLPDTIPVRTKLLEELKLYVEFMGAAHTEGCPCDDTCDCDGKSLNDAVNSIFAEWFNYEVGK